MMYWAFLLLGLGGGVVWQTNTDFTVGAMTVTANRLIVLLERDSHRLRFLNGEGELQFIVDTPIAAHHSEKPCGLQSLFFGRSLFLTGHGRAVSRKKCREWTVPRGEEILWLSPCRWLAFRTEDPFLSPGRGSELLLIENSGERVLQSLTAKAHADPFFVSVNGSRGAFRPPWLAVTLFALSPDRSLLFMGSNTALRFGIYHLPTHRFLGEIAEPQTAGPLLTKKEIEEYEEVLVFGETRYRAVNFPNPKRKPPVETIMVDENGRLWAKLWAVDGAEQALCRLYDRNGARAGSVTLPADFIPVHARDSFVWGYRPGSVQKRRYELSRD